MELSSSRFILNIDWDARTSVKFKFKFLFEFLFIIYSECVCLQYNRKSMLENVFEKYNKVFMTEYL